MKELPDAIRTLKPTSVQVHDVMVTIQMVALAGGLDHVGVVAYADDSETSEDNGQAVAEDDHWKLLDGLWYYDDGLAEADADYKDYLKSLQHEALTYLEWKRRQASQN